MFREVAESLQRMFREVAESLQRMFRGTSAGLESIAAVRPLLGGGGGIKGGLPQHTPPDLSHRESEERGRVLTQLTQLTQTFRKFLGKRECACCDAEFENPESF